MIRTLRIAAWGLFVTVFANALHGADPSARIEPFHGYEQAIVLTRGNARAVLCPQVGGRVLSFVVDGRDAMLLDDAEKAWRPGDTPHASAGRFDYGPELTTIPHPTLWSGEWSGEITGESAARLTSPRDETAGVQLIRDFALAAGDDGATMHLICRQTIRNICDEEREVCHWGRSFSPGGGICLIPLGDRPSRFPSKYAMYEDSAIINVRNTDDQIRVRDGFLEILAPPRKPKLGFDTMAGWFGYLMPNNTLFVKRFATFPDRVYNEAAGLTLSVWYPPATRIELEPIGPREQLAPGESASFVEDWWLLPFPFPAAGRQVDLAAVQSLVTTRTSPP
ncbi:MAG: hypothetical protein JNG89_09620 [Planctomycetaceae bacterium]|nr:hypothetical protein [Planctomycetaceae bacterium]